MNWYPAHWKLLFSMCVRYYYCYYICKVRTLLGENEIPLPFHICIYMNTYILLQW